MPWSRRSFLRASVLGSTGLVVGGVDAALTAIAHGASLKAEGFGPLAKDPAGILDLPKGFQYRLLSPTGASGEKRLDSKLDDGTPTPGAPDGMGAFAGPGGVTILVRNHEMDLGMRPIVDPKRRLPYDARAGGGTTTLWVDRERRLVKSFTSLSGTNRNCAGGVTPWGSWITAEESTNMPGGRNSRNADRDDRVSQRHGYLFEVDAKSEQQTKPVPLKAMGRFRHEALAVDPATGFAYLTEDRDDGLLYRFRPAAVEQGTAPSALRVGDYARGGVLEALRVRNRPQLVTDNRGGTRVKLGEPLAIDWVRIPNVDPDMDMERKLLGDVQTAKTSTRAQGLAKGSARFRQSEGIAYADGSVYFCCTEGGASVNGQVFRIRLREQTLTLMVEPDEHTLLHGPDNLCAAPWGDLIACEDTHAGRENRLIGVTPQGRCYTLAHNAHRMNGEFAGACFSADGGTLFVNIQRPGMTFAIWGPWNSRKA